MIDKKEICGCRVVLILDVKSGKIVECDLAAKWPVSRCVPWLLCVLMRNIELLVNVTLVSIGLERVTSWGRNWIQLTKLVAELLETRSGS